MKLYTEEQVKIAIDKARDYYDGFVFKEEEVIEKLIPIKLPSDDEIEKEAFQVPYNNTDKFYDESFIKGAKWMKEQILNQNK